VPGNDERRVVDVEVDPVEVVVEVELDPGSDVDVVVAEASTNSRSSKWTTLFAAALLTWKLAVKRTLWVGRVDQRGRVGKRMPAAVRGDRGDEGEADSCGGGAARPGAVRPGVGLRGQRDLYDVARAGPVCEPERRDGRARRNDDAVALCAGERARRIRERQAERAGVRLRPVAFRLIGTEGCPRRRRNVLNAALEAGVRDVVHGIRGRNKELRGGKSDDQGAQHVRTGGRPGRFRHRTAYLS
jgi:hypothetical protein